MPPHCPWDSFEPANLTFCERSLCGWVTQPANTWSNVGFLLVAAWIFRTARREARPVAGFLGVAALLTGVGSAIAHGTTTFFGQLLDQGAMFLQSAFFVAFGLRRWLGWNTRRVLAFYVALVGASIGIELVYQTAGIALFIGHIVVFAAIEARLIVRDRTTSYRPLFLACATFTVSYAVWWLDKLGLACNPDNHVLNGHCVWHFLGALSFAFWYRFFAQFGTGPAAT